MKTVLIALLLLCQCTAISPGMITWTAIGDSITYLNDHHDETGYQDNQWIYGPGSCKTSEYRIHKPGS